MPQPEQSDFTADDLPGLIESQGRIDAFRAFVLRRFLVLAEHGAVRDIRGVLVEPVREAAVAEGEWRVPADGWNRFGDQDAGATAPWIPVQLITAAETVVREVRIPLDVLFAAADPEREARHARYLALKAEFEPDSGDEPGQDLTMRGDTAADVAAAPSGTPGSPWDDPRTGAGQGRPRSQKRGDDSGLLDAIERFRAFSRPGHSDSDDPAATRDLGSMVQDARRTIEAAGAALFGPEQTQPLLRMLDQVAGVLGLPTGCPQCGSMDEPSEVTGTLICPNCGRDRTNESRE